MAQIFISHSSADNAEAVALRDWLRREGWNDIFLDVDPDRGIAAGERWERALNEAANRCEAVLFIVSRAWLQSGWCLKEFNLAHRLNKRLFGILVDDLQVADLPANLTTTWQLVRLNAGRDHVMLRVIMPVTGDEKHVTFSQEGLARLKTGLQRAGLDNRFFPWPPEDDPNRPPYRGLRPLLAEDAGIFFGREAPIIEALDRLRGLRNSAAPRFLVILGASGAGKSSFLQAGIIPRLERDSANFRVLPVLRPGRAAINGEFGLVQSIAVAMQAQDFKHSRAEIRSAIESGAAGIAPLLAQLIGDAGSQKPSGEAEAKAPSLVLPIDQGEELFTEEGQTEATALLVLLKDLLFSFPAGLIVVFTIRSDSYERLQTAEALGGILQQTMSLPPLPKGAYQSVIEGPTEKLKDGPRALKIDPALTQALLADIDADGGRDALPLLAFTLERLYLEYGGRGQLQLSDYEALGRVKGSIEAAVERALVAADADPNITHDRPRQKALMRRGLIPWLATIDFDSGNPRRRVARLSEIPVDARPMIQHLVEQRLLTIDRAADADDSTIEPAHEALLRQWGLLRGWLTEDAILLGVMDGVKRASRDWVGSGRRATWLTHTTDRLAAAQQLGNRPDLAANLDRADHDYLEACGKREAAAQARARRINNLIYVLLAGIIAGLVGWINQTYLKQQFGWYTTIRPFMLSQVRPFVLTSQAEHALKPGTKFNECAQFCPVMVVVPAGRYVMGSPESEAGRFSDEGPQHPVVIAHDFAVSMYEITFDQWDACAKYGGCDPDVPSGEWGRGRNPAINVTWPEAQQYAAWLSRMTGKNYRLLSEAEFEYAERGGTQTAYSWGNEIGKANANCRQCGSRWDGIRTAPVGSFHPNSFGLYDMSGNVWQWLEDCYHPNYADAPADGSAWVSGECSQHVVRGGSWDDDPAELRSADRNRDTPENRFSYLGIRVARQISN